MRHPKPFVILLVVCSVVLAWSAIRPRSYDVWLFEIFAGLLAVGALALTCRRFRFSGLVYLLVGVHFAVLAVAAKYTYAEMPLFNWIRDAWGLGRNYYDRVGHFFQGFVPALVAREILLRTTRLERGKMLSFIVASICLAISAFWELLEWWMVVFFYPQSGPEWLGSQGDVWDAQGDMFMALTGAVLALIGLSRSHDRSMRAAGVEPGA